MRIFVAASYSSKVNYETGQIIPEYQTELEGILTKLEAQGHATFSALRADKYKINNANQAEAFSLDEAEIIKADALFAVVTDKVSAGVQTEIGMAIATRKKVVIAHLPEHQLAYFNIAIVRAGQAKELLLPITSDPFAT